MRSMSSSSSSPFVPSKAWAWAWAWAKTNVEAMNDSASPIQRAQHFEHFTTWPVFLASILFFAATVALVSGSVHARDLVNATRLAAIACYVLILIDFLIRAVLARKDPRAFFHRYRFEMVCLILPLLRPFVILIYLWRLPAFRRSGTTLRARLLVTTFLFMLLFVYFAASVVWLFERGADGANIVNLDDAIWWGFTTLTTVGYGEYYPVTFPGRTLAVGLMLAGIAIVGTTTALVVSVLGEQLALRKDALIHPGATVSHHDPDGPSEPSGPSELSGPTTQ